LIFLTLSFISFQNASSQIKKNGDEKEGRQAVVISETPIEDNSKLDSIYMPKWLRLDMRMVDVVAYINVTEVKYSGRSDDRTNCKTGKGSGYCYYELTAEVKEVFKGKIDTETFEFSQSSDVGYPTKYFLGEQVVFLSWGEGDDKKKHLGEALENSTRRIKHNVLEKLRNILNPNSPIDENDETETYSLKYIEKNFQEADAVVYADVLSFEPDKSCDGFCAAPFILKAQIKEVFKGEIKAEQTFEYKDDLLHRPIREDDLGEQILYLEKKEENGKVFYEKVGYTEGWIQHDILEKLRKIAKEKSNGKN
jgi:hypothetical protein